MIFLHKSSFQSVQSCSHGRAYKYFAESITTEKGFYGYPRCDMKTKSEECNKQPPVLMGEYMSTETRGTYILKTARAKPFALGAYRKKEN